MGMAYQPRMIPRERAELSMDACYTLASINTVSGSRFMSSSRSAVWLIALLLFASLLGACGQKGALYLPEEPPVATPDDQENEG